MHNRARGANKHYPTATLDDICRLAPPVASDSILLMWTISSHLEDTFRVIKAWGFEYKAIAWWWLKVSLTGAPRIGMGYWTRQVGELCLLATRGNPPSPAYRAEPGIIIAPRGERHSAKPEEQYAKIDRLFPDAFPRLEMFARGQARPGWDVFGNEVEGSITLDYAPVQLAMDVVR